MVPFPDARMSCPPSSYMEPSWAWLLREMLQHLLMLVFLRGLHLIFSWLLVRNDNASNREIDDEVSLGMQRLLKELDLFDKFTKKAFHSILFELNRI